MRVRTWTFVLVWVLWGIHITTLWGAQAAGPLRVHRANPRYFDDGTGKAVYLAGAHTHNNLQDMATTDPPPVFNFDNDCAPDPSQGGYLPWNDCYLDFLEYYGHNFTRGWAWEQAKWAAGETADWYFNPLPFQRTGPGAALDGKPKFDLTRYNAAYFSRLRDRAIAAGKRGYYISIMLFEGWSIEDKDIGKGNPWRGHPFNASNNINGINGDSNGDGEGHEVHTLPSDPYHNPPVSPAVTDLQEAYVAHCIDQLNDLDNILWEISNESHAASANWHYHMIDFIQGYQANKPKQHLVWMNAYDLDNATLFAPQCRAEVVSPNRRGPNYRSPPVWSENKIVVLDTDHLWGWGGDRDFVWRAFTRGYHPIYMDPLQQPSPWPPGDARSIRVRQALGDTLVYAKKLDLAVTLPSTPVCSTGHCLVNEGIQYLAFQPTAGAGFSLTLPAGQYDYEWFDPQTSRVTNTGTITASGGSKNFTNPYSGMAVLYLLNSGPRMPVSYNLGEPDFANGMSHPQPADGNTVPISFGGRSCRTNGVPGTDLYFYFGIDYPYNGSLSEAYIVIDYYDTGSGSLVLQYDSNTGEDNAAKYKEGGSVLLTGRNAWLQHVFHVTDAYFGDRQNGGADFRIAKPGGGSVYLDLVRVSDEMPPSFLQQPQPTKVHLGQAAAFSVSAAGGGTLAYQWQQDGQDLGNDGNRTGTRTSVLHIEHVRPADAGEYQCVVRNSTGSVVSDAVSLTLTVLGDFDVDDDVDQADFGRFQTCFSGSTAPYEAGCEDADLDGNRTVDVADFVLFQACMGGANLPPGC